MLKRIFLLSLLAFSTVAFAQATATYKNTAARFQMSYPKAWTARENVMGTTVFVAKLNPQGFSTNVNVIVQTVPKGTTLKAMSGALEQQLSSVITDFKLLSQKNSTLGGQPALVLSYTGRQGKYALTWDQSIVIRGTSNYIVTFTAETAVYKRERAPLPAILSSFKFL